MFLALGRLIWRVPVWFLASAFLVVGAAAWYGDDVIGQLTLDPGWDVPGSGSARARQDLRDRLGRDDTAVILLFSPKPGGPGNVDAPAYRDAAETVLSGLGGNPEVRGIESYFASADPHMKSADGRSSYAVVWLARGHDEGIGAYQRLRTSLASPVLHIATGGELAAYVDAREHLEHDIRQSEWLSFLLLAVLLVWVFGSPVAALLPLLIGGMSVAASAALLKMVAQHAEISVYAANVVSMLGLGLAIDYALFIVSRYREELAHGGGPERVLIATFCTAGRTVAFSGVTVAASLFCLLMLPQRFFQNMGLAGGISVAAAMLASILVLPALLALVGSRLGGHPRSRWRIRLRARSDGAWRRFGHFVTHRPRRVLAASLAVLGIMGLPILHMEIGPADSKSLPPSAESRRVQETLESDFPGAQLSPLVLSLHLAGDAATGPGLTGQYTLARAVEALPGVTRVAGLASLDGGLSLADYQLLYGHPDQFPLAAASLAQFAHGDRALMLVYYRYDPSSVEARELVRHLRALALPDGLRHMDVGGVPAEYLDYVDSLRHWTPRVIAAIVAVIAVLLFLMLGSVVLPIKAVLTNLISLSATFGGLVWIFQDGHLAQWLGFTAQGRLEGTVLVLIFASAFGLSIDYEVFLLSRVREMRGRTGGDARAIAAGMHKSGPIITRAALLIGIVLGTFAMGDLVFMKAMGIGLLISVIVDATVVRMLLVPASLRLLGPWMWWAPASLRVVYDRVHQHFAPPPRT
ncbi:MMPL family transporter [Parasulfuritortus cantonensis]|uniref:MMPL family transporter n=1 Tax=Parasulfuritortus cantonensis TaxID=2528202 RepID=A0A4R1BCD4_9PROT|nr:MMPL family transporter [Parasulfuritortus cantonensis]TCJ14705.1 MMPL family transporter [Parasulfuritortus cantonensis]